MDTMDTQHNLFSNGSVYKRFSLIKKALTALRKRFQLNYIIMGFVLQNPEKICTSFMIIGE